MQWVDWRRLSERRSIESRSIATPAASRAFGGENAGAHMKAIRQAQSAACNREELGGKTLFVKTTQFHRPKEESPNVGHGHHWFGNAESYFLIGDALGKAMVDLAR